MGGSLKKTTDAYSLGDRQKAALKALPKKKEMTLRGLLKTIADATGTGPKEAFKIANGLVWRNYVKRTEKSKYKKGNGKKER